MYLTVLIPMFNEAQTIVPLMSAVVRSCRRMGITFEILAVNDGSTDQTWTLARQFREDYSDVRIRLVHLQTNQGKGACLQAGMCLAEGEWVVIQDADLEYDPIDYKTMLEATERFNADIVYGSRFLAREAVSTFWHRGGNRVLTDISNWCTGFDLTDVHTGLKLFRGTLIRGIALEEKRFGFCPEITAKLAKMGATNDSKSNRSSWRQNAVGVASDRAYRLTEVAVSYRPRTKREGKKIGWVDGLRAVWCSVWYTWLSRRPETTDPNFVVVVDSGDVLFDSFQQVASSESCVPKVCGRESGGSAVAPRELVRNED